MYRVTVLFGQPQDPAEFERYYRQIHFPLAAKLKGIQGVTIGKLEPVASQQPVRHYRITSFYFDSREACQEVLASPEGQAALADLNNFAMGGFCLVGNEEEVLVPFSSIRGSVGTASDCYPGEGAERGADDEGG